jgi:hypothetical protein
MKPVKRKEKEGASIVGEKNDMENIRFGERKEPL